MMVSFASVFTLVLETRLEPGSLKAMWPSGPIPDRTERAVGNLLSLQKWLIIQVSISAQWLPDLRQRAESLQQLLSSLQRFRTLLAGQRRCHPGCGCSRLLCLCAWRSYSTWRSGSSQGDLWEALYGILWQFLMQHHSFFNDSSMWNHFTRCKTYLHIHPCWMFLRTGMRLLHSCSTRSVSCNNQGVCFLKTGKSLQSKSGVTVLQAFLKQRLYTTPPPPLCFGRNYCILNRL